MNQAEAIEKIVKILAPHAKKQDALANVSLQTNILDDLEVNSARLVDVVLAFEDEFDIEIPDEDVDSINTVGDCVTMILKKVS